MWRRFVVVLLATLVMSCGDDPLPTEPDMSCTQSDVGIRAQRERTGQEVNFFDSGERVIVSAIPLGGNSGSSPLPDACRFSRTATWTVLPESRSVHCDVYGEVAGMAQILLCESFAGDQSVTISVKHGGFGNSRRFRVIG